MSSPQSFTLTRGPIELTGCDREQIQYIGSVQSHGALLLFDANPPYRLIGSSNGWRQTVPPQCDDPQVLSDFFTSNLVDQILEADETPGLLPETLSNGAELTAHLYRGKIYLEAESPDGADVFDSVACLSACLEAMNRSRNSDELLTALALRLQNALAVSRVMIYKFLPDWTGEVVAEAARDECIYHGLRFPASDIPKPARAIFSRCWVRHIADVQADGSPLKVQSGSADLIDLTHVSLRSSAAIHLEYLKNMEVSASLTLSLRVGDRLWGLIACHHDAPHRLQPSQRTALETLARIASSKLENLISRETKSERVAGEATVSSIIEALETRQSLELSPHKSELKELVECDMFALYEDSQWNVPRGLFRISLERFADWVRPKFGQGLLLHYTELPPSLVQGFAGVIVAAPTGPTGVLACWFRREQSHSVRWAGRPDKTRTTPTQRLSPRASFAEYVEVTAGKALEWSQIDLWKVERFLSSYQAAAVLRNRQLQIINQALARSNTELDSFAYMASHDLKEPIRGISNYASFLKEDYGHVLEGDAHEYLTGLIELTERMNILVDGLLSYSRLNSQEMELSPCPLDAMVEDAASLLRYTRGVEIDVDGPLPVVLAYPPFLREVIQNLLTNAAKYTDDGERRIQVGALPETASEWTFYVKDNGIGIDPSQQEQIFLLFQRLHPEGARGGGSGLGLTIVKKMVKRHGGEIWVESSLGEGSTFFVSLPKRANEPSEHGA